MDRGDYVHINNRDIGWLIFIIKTNTYLLNIQDTLNKLVNYALRCLVRAHQSQDGTKAVIENVDDYFGNKTMIFVQMLEWRSC